MEGELGAERGCRAGLCSVEGEKILLEGEYGESFRLEKGMFLHFCGMDRVGSEGVKGSMLILRWILRSEDLKMFSLFE